MSMQELIVIDSKPAILSVNFEVLKNHLTTELEKYDVVVTIDTVKDAKALATELNTTKRLIDTKRKDEVAKASEPVKQFDTNMKELVTMCETGRQKILIQVQRFEDETRELAKNLLLAYRQECWDRVGVTDEFCETVVDDLAVITAVTGKGALALSAKRSVDERVAADKAKQDKVDRRLLLLENQSLRAGLASPLTRDHVQSFLFQPDDAYQSQLDRIIASEIGRQKEAEEKLREKINNENALLEAAQTKPEIAAPAAAPQVQAAPESTQETPAASVEPAIERITASAPQAATVTCFITCNFEIQVDPRAPEEVIQQKFIEKIKGAGFQSLSSVFVNKQKAAA